MVAEPASAPIIISAITAMDLQEMDVLQLPPKQSQPSAIRLTGTGSDTVLSTPRASAAQALNVFSSINSNGWWTQDPLFIQLGIEGDDV